jgi:hypothetical protein
MLDKKTEASRFGFFVWQGINRAGYATHYCDKMPPKEAFTRYSAYKS